MATEQAALLSAPDTVDQENEGYKHIKDFLKLVEDLRKGTHQLRQEHELYLPSFSKEERKNYERRWKQATLYPAFEETISMLVGKAFSKPPDLDENDVPVEIVGTETEKGFMENIDLQGTHFQVFAENYFKKAMRSGLCHLLVDSTPMPAGAITEAQKQAAGHRPYWVLYDALQVFAWRYDVVGGRPVLTQVRIKEEIQEDYGEFGTKKYEQIRVLEIGRYRIFRKVEGTWVEIKEGEPGGGGAINGYDGQPLTYIPLVTLYTDEDNGFMTAVPQLLDLAYQNIRHFQKQSDYDNYMSVACFPVFCATGIPSDEQTDIALGPFTVCKSTSPDAKYFFAEHSGAALSAARQDLEDLKGDMAMHGMRLMLPRASGAQPPTATAESIAEGKFVSQLQVAVLRLKDCLEQALEYTARWLGLGTGKGGSVKVDIKTVALSAADVDQLLKAAGSPQRPVLDVETVIEELKRRGFLDENVDAKEVMTRLENTALQSPVAGLAGAFLKPPVAPSPKKPPIPGGAGAPPGTVVQ